MNQIDSSELELDQRCLISRVTRPGISPETLAKNEVRFVSSGQATEAVGYSASGLLIPYHALNGEPVIAEGKPYARLRLNKPTLERKYHQPVGSSVRAYIPAGLLDCVEDAAQNGLTLVEGEFKALALTEAGFPAIGLSGFYGFQQAKGEKLLPEIDEAIKALRPAVIYFCGDSDTSLNCQFSDAAIRLQKALPNIPLKLPRIPLVGFGKGVDDCKDTFQGAFPKWWSEIMHCATPLIADMQVAELATDLLNGQRDTLARFIEESGEAGKAKVLSFIKSIEQNSTAYTTARKIVADATGLLDASSRIGRIKGKELPELYYWEGSYYRADLEGNYMKILSRDAERELKYAGFGNRKQHNEASEIDVAIREIQRKYAVDAVGQLCGRKPGVFVENGFKFLVTRGPNIIQSCKPVTGDEASPMFEFLNAVFGRGENREFEHQLLVFMAWLQRARRALFCPDRHLEGQMLLLVGPAGCGKTYLQTLVTKMLGGRSCDPSLWMKDGSTFNGDLWQNEHLCMSDTNLPPSGKGKTAMRDKIKEIVANSTFPYHQKNKEQISFRPIWRVTLSANDDIASTNVLPALEKSTSDKLIYFKCYTSENYFPHEKDRDFHHRAIIDSLPFFLHYVDNLEVSSDYTSSRWGVTAWHHPECVELLESYNPELEIAEILEKWLSTKPSGIFTINATGLYEDLDRHLLGNLRRCSKNSLVLGHQLGRLMSCSPWDKVIQKEIRREGPNRSPKVYYRFDPTPLNGESVDKEVTEWLPVLSPEV